MTPNEKQPTLFGEVRRKLLLSLAINALLPLVAYGLLRLAGVGELLALAVAAAIPAARTVVLWVWRRRLDWIGLQALVGFAAAAAGTIFLSGNPLLLEVHSSLLTGTAGIVLLFSAAIGKPLLQTLAQAFARDNPRLSALVPDNPERRKVMRLATAIIGLAFLADAAAHVALALTAPVDVFVSVSRVLNWGILAAGAASVWWLRQRAAQNTRTAQQR